MKILKTGIDYWTHERCFEEAKKYNSLKDFYKQCEPAYRVAKKQGWISEYTWFVSPKVERKWTYDTCYKAAKECSSKIEFETKYSAAMNLARKNDWLKEYTWFKRPKATNIKWTYETCKAESAKYAQRGDFAKYSKTAYLKSWKNGWLDEFFPEKK